jgi:hypothetical protein
LPPEIEILHSAAYPMLNRSGFEQGFSLEKKKGGDVSAYSHLRAIESLYATFVLALMWEEARLGYMLDFHV